MLVPLFCENRDSTLPDSFYESLPMHCFECGYPMEMTEVLTQLHCSNPRCPNKVVKRMTAIANSLGVKDLGESRAKKFVTTFDIDNPLMIFGYEPEYDGQMADDISLDVSKKIADQFIEKKRFTLAEYVRIANLPFIQTSASAIFGSFDSLEEAYNQIEAGGVEYIRRKLDIKSAEDASVISVRAIRVFETLMTFKKDLFDCIGFVEIVSTNKEGMKNILAVCSDDVGCGYRTKAEFYAKCNNKYPDIHIDFGTSVTKKTEYVVWAGADGSPARLTNKVKKARAYNEGSKNDHEIQIVTADQFTAILDQLEEG